MVKYNHKKINTKEELRTQLLHQEFSDLTDDAMVVHYKSVAKAYSEIENSIVVLTDLYHKRSYVYHSLLSKQLGLKEHEEEIDSIFEEDIYNLIHPDDAYSRHLLEIQFLNFVRQQPLEERPRYQTINKLRMRAIDGRYIPVVHRTFYLKSQSNGSVWFALCLYNHGFIHEDYSTYKGAIINNVTGEMIEYGLEENQKILSNREREVLQLIERGLLSKEIAATLNISLNTVNRHRQNIMEKFNVSNSFEAIKIARSLNILAF